MNAASLLAGLAVVSLVSAEPARADTLFLRNGKSLKVEALSCNPVSCVVALAGGDIEVRALDVLRVEPDEEVDAEPAGAVASAPNRTVSQVASRSLEGMVTEAAHKHALPRSLVRAVARAESGLNPIAVSSKGAQGVMQLMPGTARDLGVRDAFDPEENIDAGARLLRQLLEKYQGRLAEALAAYNAGAGAVARHKGIPPYPETRGYIRRIVADFERRGDLPTAPASEKRK